MAKKYKNRIYRILDIITLLDNRSKKWKAKDFAERFGISVRTFHRDREIMESVGIPIYNRKDLGTYEIKDTYKFSPPDLTKKEAMAIALICRGFDDEHFPYYRELNIVRAKLINSLSIPVQKIIKKLEGKIMLEQSMNIDLSSHLDTIRKIEKAVDEEKKIEMEYYSISSDEKKKRILAPYGIAYREGAGYVVGFCYLRNEKRMFRIDRIKNIKVLRKKFNIPKDFSLEDYFENTWGVERGEKRWVKIIFKGFAARFVEEGDWHDRQRIKRLDEKRVQFTVETGSMKELKRWILSFGCEAKVVEPKELREELKVEIEKMRSVY